MKKNNKLVILNKGILLSVFLMISNLVAAQDSAEQGLQIAKERKESDTGWGDSVAEMTMILRDSQGQESERRIRTKSFEVLTDGDKALTIFDEPRDVKGTAFLTFSHATEPDDQWIFLPALKRVKRISSRNKSGPFMGSEFAYEDLSSFELEKYKFNLLGEEIYNGQSVYLLEQIPVDKFSGYTRQKLWIDKERHIAFKIEFYDRKDSLLKVLELSDYKQYKNKYWRPHKSKMVNKQNGKSTDLNTHSIEFKTGLEDGDFNKNSLKRAR